MLQGYLKKLLDVREANGLDADPEKIAIYLQPEEADNYNVTSDHRSDL